MVSNIFYFHPYLGKIPILTNIFQMGWNHQPVNNYSTYFFTNVTYLYQKNNDVITSIYISQCLGEFTLEDNWVFAERCWCFFRDLDQIEFTGWFLGSQISLLQYVDKDSLFVEYLVSIFCSITIHQISRVSHRSCIIVFISLRCQWLFLVPLTGGRDYITHQKAIYKWYISGIYCQLGDYMPPTTF